MRLRPAGTHRLTWLSSTYVLIGVETLLLLYTWSSAAAVAGEIHHREFLRAAIFGSGAGWGAAQAVLRLDMLVVGALWLGFRGARPGLRSRWQILQFLGPALVLAAIAWNVRALSEPLPPIYAHVVYAAEER